MAEETFFLFLTENMEQKNPVKQEHQEYHDHEWSDGSNEEIKDNSEINPKYGHSGLAAYQAQAKLEELYSFDF